MDMSSSEQNHHNLDKMCILEKTGDKHSVLNSNFSTQPLLSRRYKTVLLIIGVLAFVAVLTVLVAVAIAVRTSLEVEHESKWPKSSQQQRGDPLINMKKREQLLKQVANLKGIQKRQTSGATSKSQTLEASCYSVRTNLTYPAAHIAGQGYKWSNVEPRRVDSPPGEGYQTSWACSNKGDAYVDGGMFFNQKDKKLYVPTCGYYYISSHVFFQSDPSTSDSTNQGSDYVRHQISIERNCSYPDDSLLLRSYSSLTATPENVGRTTTYIGDVVKICAGGTISVVIPNDRYNPCCAYGRSQTTYLSAFMVAETTCDPPRILSNPPN